MAAPVLGKRSRQVIDSEDLSLELPQTKRRTRRAAPTIYEDVQQTHTKQSVTLNNTVQKSLTRLTRSKRPQSVQTATTDADRRTSKDNTPRTQPSEPDVDIENIAPAQLSTPTTVRFKDFLAVESPSTPKHRVRLAGASLTPHSSRKTQTSSRAKSAFSTARQLFSQASNSTRLVGRDVERQQVRQFISEAIESKTGGCTYVSGPPGTGKSALVQEVLHEFDNHDNVQTSVINCVSLRTANDIFGQLWKDFSSDNAVGKSSLKQCLSRLFLQKSTGRMSLILLDEIDNLLDVDGEVLYTIFEWAMHKSSSIILLGIANALDLTDRFLPRLKARGLKPNLLAFLPYTAPQISTIISDKLRSLLAESSCVSKDFVPFMQPAAISLCGKKIASQTGDLRKAFSLVRRIIDQLEAETLNKIELSSPSRKPLGEASNSAGSPPTPTSSSKPERKLLNDLTPETAPRATIAHAAKVASTIFNNGTLSRVSGLNLQQKAVLCSLVAGEKRKSERSPYVTPSKSTNKIPSIKELFFKYSTLCKRDDGLLQPLKDTEFRDVVASLETLGLVHEHKGRTSSLLTPTSTPSRSGRNVDDKQIVSAVSEKEMRESLGGVGADLLRRLLDDY